MEYVVLGGGCFWCVEAVYRRTAGVVSAVSGYAGGTVENPTYESVCSGTTGHAEVVQVTYDEQETSLESILDVFWAAHDPTTKNRQGADIGTQYRSIILYEQDAHKAIIQRSVKRAQKTIKKRIVTEIAKLTVLYQAEDYHQDFFTKNPLHGYCTAVIRPKLQRIRNA